MHHVPSKVKGLWSKAFSSFGSAKASFQDKLLSAPSRLPKAPSSRPASADCDHAAAKHPAVPSLNQMWQVYSIPLADPDAGHITNMDLPRVFPAAEMVNNPLAEVSDEDDQEAALALAATPHAAVSTAQQPAPACRLARCAGMSKPEQATATNQPGGIAVPGSWPDHTNQLALAAVSPAPARKTRAAAAAAKQAVTQLEAVMHSS